MATLLAWFLLSVKKSAANVYTETTKSIYCISSLYLEMHFAISRNCYTSSSLLLLRLKWMHSLNLLSLTYLSIIILWFQSFVLKMLVTSTFHSRTVYITLSVLMKFQMNCWVNYEQLNISHIYFNARNNSIACDWFNNNTRWHAFWSDN